MVTRVCLTIAGILLLAVPASAQRFEAGASGGFSGSEGISSDARLLLERTFNTLSVNSGTTFNVTFGVFFNEQVSVEFLAARQSSRLEASGRLAGDLDVAELAIYNYMVNFVFHWNEAHRLRPYVFVGLGATSYSFGNSLLEGSAGTLDRQTQFSSDWGAGVKYYLTPTVGTRFGFRWTPTAISGTAEGIFCDPSLGCWPVTNQQYSNQLDVTGGLTVRF